MSPPSDVPARIQTKIAISGRLQPTVTPSFSFAATQRAGSRRFGGAPSRDPAQSANQPRGLAAVMEPLEAAWGGPPNRPKKSVTVSDDTRPLSAPWERGREGLTSRRPLEICVLHCGCECRLQKGAWHWLICSNPNPQPPANRADGITMAHPMPPSLPVHNFRLLDRSRCSLKVEGYRSIAERAGRQRLSRMQVEAKVIHRACTARSTGVPVSQPFPLPRIPYRVSICELG